MGWRCKFFGCDWVTIFSHEKSIISFSLLDTKRPDRESHRTLIIEECIRCKTPRAKLADTVGNCESVDVDAAIHEMKAHKKRTKPKKTIAVQVKDGNILIPTEGLKLNPDKLEAKVYHNRIEIRSGD